MNRIEINTGERATEIVINGVNQERVTWACIELTPMKPPLVKIEYNGETSRKAGFGEGDDHDA